jgi:hypothetical protein
LEDLKTVGGSSAGSTQQVVLQVQVIDAQGVASLFNEVYPQVAVMNAEGANAGAIAAPPYLHLTPGSYEVIFPQIAPEAAAQLATAAQVILG